MSEIESLFTPMIGKISWGIQQTHGSCFLIEFGNPRIKSLGPLAIKDDMSLEQQRRIRRRRPVLYGQWTLLIQDCAWTLHAWETVANESSTPVESRDSFENLNGQILQTVKYNPVGMSCVFEFDLGARLTTRSRLDNDPVWIQWTLGSDERYVSLLNSGDIVSGSVDGRGRDACQ